MKQTMRVEKIKARIFIIPKKDRKIIKKIIKELEKLEKYHGENMYIPDVMIKKLKGGKRKSG